MINVNWIIIKKTNGEYFKCKHIGNKHFGNESFIENNWFIVPMILDNIDRSLAILERTTKHILEWNNLKREDLVIISLNKDNFSIEIDDITKLDSYTIYLMTKTNLF